MFATCLVTRRKQPFQYAHVPEHLANVQFVFEYTHECSSCFPPTLSIKDKSFGQQMSLHPACFTTTVEFAPSSAFGVPVCQVSPDMTEAAISVCSCSTTLGKHLHSCWNCSHVFVTRSSSVHSNPPSVQTDMAEAAISVCLCLFAQVWRTFAIVLNLLGSSS